MQSSSKTEQLGKFSRKAWAADSSLSMAHNVSAMPAWWNPSERPENKIRLLLKDSKCC